MPSFSATELMAGLLFGSIGLVAFVYGKRQQLWRPMFTGLALMIYPYFVSDGAIAYAIGVVLTASLFLYR
jgi:hypothetical protein